MGPGSNHAGYRVKSW